MEPFDRFILSGFWKIFYFNVMVCPAAFVEGIKEVDKNKFKASGVLAKISYLVSERSGVRKDVS